MQKEKNINHIDFVFHENGNNFLSILKKFSSQTLFDEALGF